jgi:hypothetical protein
MLHWSVMTQMHAENCAYAYDGKIVKTQECCAIVFNGTIIMKTHVQVALHGL